jgi:hypothetical protein
MLRRTRKEMNKKKMDKITREIRERRRETSRGQVLS